MGWGVWPPSPPPPPPYHPRHYPQHHHDLPDGGVARYGKPCPHPFLLHPQLHYSIDCDRGWTCGRQYSDDFGSVTIMIILGHSCYQEKSIFPSHKAKLNLTLFSFENLITET